MTIKLPQKTRYAVKDQLKANQCNKFIGRGSVRSSTHAYSIAFGKFANTGEYVQSDVVMVSCEGDRYGRKAIDTHELYKAIYVGATFITDAYPDRQRKYNVGEREVASLLVAYNYQERSPGVWTSRATNYPRIGKLVFRN